MTKRNDLFLLLLNGLEGHESKCLDNDEEREAVARDLADKVLAKYHLTEKKDVTP